MVPVEPGVYTSLGLTVGADEAAIRDAIASQSDALPVLSAAGLGLLVQTLLASECRSLKLLAPFSQIAQWRYATIADETSIVAEFLFCPSDGFAHSTLPPSAGEKLIVDAWSSGLCKLADFHDVVLCDVTPGKIDSTRFDALCTALSCGPPALHPKIPSYLDSRNSLFVPSKSRFVDKRHASYPDLLRGALLETAVRWRFLQFYRILEQGYLDVIFEKLKREYILSPRSALAVAQESVESEYQQLKNLVVEASLETYFESILQAIEGLKSSGNRFSFALAKKTKSYRSESRADKGAAFAYAIRCAIAHAGGHDIFYEQYVDADALVAAVLPILEEAVYTFLGLTAV